MGIVLRGGAQDNVAAAACRGDTTGDIPKGFRGGYQPFLEGTFSNTTMRLRNLRNCVRNTALFESLVGGAKGTVLSGRGRQIAPLRPRSAGGDPPREFPKGFWESFRTTSRA